VRSVRERLLFARPLADANESIESGPRSAIRAKSQRFRSDRILASHANLL
jgi:hypothetical protein